MNMDKSLKQLYLEHKGKISDRWSLYLDEWDRLFAPYRSRQIRLLEIGIQNSGSLEVWGMYFPKAEKIVGCDIDQNCERLRYDDARIVVLVGDANSDVCESKILQQAPTFDILIDDGSHKSSDIVRSFARYFSHINDGGIYIVEDLHASYWKDYEGGLHDPLSAMAFFKRLVDVVNYEHWRNNKPRRSLLRVFAENLGIEFKEFELASIHSIEFVNSLCIIKKLPPEKNVLGNRIIVGTHEYVSSGVKRFNGTVIQDYAMEIKDDANLDVFELIARINFLTTTLIEREQAVQGFSAQLTENLINKLWEFSSFLRKNLLKLIPQGSRREKYVLLLFRALSVWKNAGIIALGWKVKDRLESISRYQQWIYQQWILKNETDPKTLLAHQDASNVFQACPLISVVMPVYNPPLEFLEEAIKSVKAQTYTHFELCIVDDASPDPGVRALIEKYAHEDSRIHYIFREVNGHISAASNSALELVTGEYFALLDHDDKLHPLALYYVAQEIINHPDAEVIYSDEDKLDESGKRKFPYFKTDFNYDLLLCQNMISHLGVYKTATVRHIGGFRVGLEGSQDYDLVLRILEHIKPHQVYHIPRVLYHWRISDKSTAAGITEKPYAYAAARRAIAEHLERLGVAASVEFFSELSSYRVRYSLPEPHPSVEVIIHTQKPSDKLNVCINSILAKTKYDNYGISLIINKQIDTMDQSWIKQWGEEGRVSIIQNEFMVSQARAINQLVKDSKADYVCILDERLQDFSAEWLPELLAHAVQPGVGAVGPKILSSKYATYSGGMILGVDGIAGNLFLNLPTYDPGYFGWAKLQRSITILSPACFMVNRSRYLEVAGLEDTLFSYHYSCIDFFLKLMEKGLRNIHTPYSQVIDCIKNPAYAEKEATAMGLKNDREYMISHWQAWIDHDPSFNPNLDLKKGRIVLAKSPRINYNLE